MDMAMRAICEWILDERLVGKALVVQATLIMYPNAFIYLHPLHSIWVNRNPSTARNPPGVKNLGFELQSSFQVNNHIEHKNINSAIYADISYTIRKYLASLQCVKSMSHLYLLLDD